MRRPVVLHVHRAELAVCRLDPGRELPDWVTSAGWWSATGTPDELSVVVPVAHVPAGVAASGPWRRLEVLGPLEHDVVGVLAGLAAPLAGAGVSIFALSTYDTDHVLVGADRVERAVVALRSAGYDVVVPPGG